MNLDVKEERPVVDLKAEPVMSEATRKSFSRFAIFIAVLSLCFWKPISELVKRALETELYSHILLIPFISLYLGWLRRGSLPGVSDTPSPLPSPPLRAGERVPGKNLSPESLNPAENVQRSTFNVQRSNCGFGAPTALPLPVRNERGEGQGEGQRQERRPSSPQPSPPSEGGEGEEPGALKAAQNVQRSTFNVQRSTLSIGRWTFLIPFVAGLAALVVYGVASARGIALDPDDYLALTIASFVCLVAAGGVAILGTAMVRALAFPLGFLAFMIPFPAALTHGIEMFFQYTTSDVSHFFFLVSGTPVFRDKTMFQLPGLVIRVAEECSGIRSSLVLFITSLVAGCLFLRSPWKRAVLALAVIPLGIVRNAIRVFTIAWLCLHVDPNAINSPIHHRGGPVFFLVSLVPFFLLLQWLRKSERTRKE